MNGTKKRIENYKELLPHLKEKVVAVALLLAMSSTMLVTVSFAWLALSKSPEVADVATSIASNGNLEIALVGAEGKIPPVSAEGDSNKDLIARNITWGNLVNLSDPAYGLDNLVLRPAQLNTAQLATNPLYGAVYSDDGRMEKLNTSFGYATWQLPEGNKPGYFKITNDLGVRAISSVTREVVGGMETYYALYDDASNTNAMAGSAYVSIANDSKKMQSLATMMGLYMTARMNPDNESLSNPTCTQEDVLNLTAMYKEFKVAFELEAEAIAAMLNFQLFLIKGENYEPYDSEDIFTLTAAQLASNSDKLKVTDLTQFQKDYNTIVSDMAKLEEIAKIGASKWKDSGLNNVVNNLVNVGACTIGANNTPISSIGASNASSYLSGTQEARITNGILYRFEERTGGNIDVKSLSIAAEVERYGIQIPATVKANVKTTAPRDYNLFSNDLAYSESLFTGTFEGGEEVANDTYGFAIDLWVRTNADGSYLTLEGNVLTKEETVRDTTKDRDGNEVELWTLTTTEEVTNEETGDTETITTSVDLYQIVTENEDGATTTTWYNAITHSVYTIEEGQTPIEKMKTIETVIGYEGENRIWDGSVGLSVNSTTQGSGSCYVYYANSPEDQARSLKLLESMKIAFADEKGKLLAEAEMDTEHYYADNGKVIVPMVLSSNAINLGVDINGNTIYGITALEKNVATRITAIVYLDGTDLSNSDVLSSADIQGQMNIQFGSSTNLKNADNEELRIKEMAVSASLDKTSFNYDEASESNPMTTNVSVTVDGDQPKDVKAFFIRSINSTQGSREETMTFTFDEASRTWKSAYTFTSPGNYILRSVQLDGIDYELASPQTVEIEGFTVKLLNWGADSSNTTIMTAAASTSVDLTLQFASNDENKMPKEVRGRFIREDGTVANVEFKYNSTTTMWTGTVKFVTSGEYSLQYLVLDGEYQEIDPSMQKFATVYLGMKVAVYTSSRTNFKFVPSEMEEGGYDVLEMQVKIMDDTDNLLEALGNVQLTYALRGSSVKTMNCDLVWDAARGYYIGEFNALEAGAGIYTFSRVNVESNVITYATTSPTFTMISPEPPAYVSAVNSDYEFNSNNNANFTADLAYTSTATVWAKIQNSDTGVIQDVQGAEPVTNGNNTTWKFTIPNGTHVSGRQDGHWQLVEIDVWDYYDADGNYTSSDIDEETGEHIYEPMAFDLTNSNITKKVVTEVKVTFAEGQSKDFGKDANGNVTGEFMDSYTISGLTVTIQDFEGSAIPNVNSVNLKYVYKNDSSVYGGYTGDTLNNAAADFTIALTGSGATFTQSGEQTIRYAGSWNTELNFTINGKNYTYAGDKDTETTKALPANAPVFTVWSKVPYVKFTATNPATGTTFTGANEAGDGTVDRQNVISADGYSVTVYYQASGSDNGCGGGSCSGYTPSTATLGLYDAGINFTGGTCTISSKGNGADVVYSFTPGTTSATLFNEQSLGSANGTTRNGIGSGAQATQLILTTSDGTTYTFTLKNAINATAQY